MPMDFPEARMLERDLKSFGLDAATALAVLLNTLGDDHLARVPRLEPVDDLADDFEPDNEANARTTLERVLHILKLESRKNGDLAARHDDHLGATEAFPPCHPRRRPRRGRADDGAGHPPRDRPPLRRPHGRLRPAAAKGRAGLDSESLRSVGHAAACGAHFGGNFANSRAVSR
jgi:hypothetical protein